MRAVHVVFGSIVVSTAIVGATCACGDTPRTGSNSTSGTAGNTASGGGGSGGAGTAGAGGSLFTDGGGGCTQDGDPCEDGGVCAGGACCAAASACGSACCASAEVCSFQKCVTPGAPCIDATECPEGQYCEYALGEPVDGGAPDGSCQGGVVPQTGKCLPKPPECPPGAEPGPNDPISCLPHCEYKPPVGDFTPVVKYAWGMANSPNDQHDVMMTPIVIQLDDDTCDGVVDERDIPEIVFLSFKDGAYGTNGTLHAISIVGGAVVEKWSVVATSPPNHPGRAIAAGNIDGVPGNEIVVCTTDNRVRAHRADGTELWLSAPAAPCLMPSLADLDQDGKVEVVVEGQILDGATGASKVPAFAPSNKSNVVVSDVDNPPDSKLDIVTASKVYRADGTLLVDTGLVNEALLDQWSRAYPAVGDLDGDGAAEIVASYGPSGATGIHDLLVWRLNPAGPEGFEIIRQGVDVNGMLGIGQCTPGSNGGERGGGPPTIADFNGDGVADVALAGGVGYAVFDGKKLMDPAIADIDTILWITPTKDCSSAFTGSSVFDFDGDGKAEVVYADELLLHVYSGVDGSVLFETCNTNGTLFEYPLVADVDNDGQADIVVVSNSYHDPFQCMGGGQTAGVRIFGDEKGNWVRTRRVWNQHAYHVTNVAEDGTIPAIEAPNYTQPKLNNFRQNVQPLGEFSAPDLVVAIGPTCTADYGLRARVRNIGSAAVPAGVPVGFYAGDPLSGGTELPGSPLFTTKVLYPAEAEELVLPLPDPPEGVEKGTTPIFAVADDKAPPHAWHECRTDNNVSPPGSGVCGAPR